MSLLERFGAYVSHNRWAIVRDMIAAVVWVVVLGIVFRTGNYSETLYYALLFGGVFVYAWLVPSWERPEDAAE